MNVTHNWTIKNNLVNEAHFTYFRESQGNFLHPQRTNLVQDSCTTVSPDACFNDGTARNDRNSPRSRGQPRGCAFRRCFRIVSASATTSKVKSRRLATPIMVRQPELGQGFTHLEVRWGLSPSALRPNAVLQRQWATTATTVVALNDVGFDDLMPNYLLGLPGQLQPGLGADRKSAQQYLLGVCPGQLEDQAEPDTELRFALGAVYSAHRRQRTRAEFSSGADQHDLSLLQIHYAVRIARQVWSCPAIRECLPGLTTTYYKTFAPRIGIA